MAEIVLDQVTKRFPDGALAVDAVSLEIADGDRNVVESHLDLFRLSGTTVIAA